jgi:zinc transport system substrate-binding protein
METAMPIRFLAPLSLGMTLASGAMADAPRVATDIAPVQSLVARVMQGVGEPDVIVRSGASPHGYAMRPSEAAALEEADLVFWMGEGLTPWLEGAIDALASEAHAVELLGAAGSRVLPFREGVAFETHDDHGHDDHGHDDHDHDDHGHEDKSHEDKDHEDHAEAHDHDHEHGHDHAHDGADPHAWLDPANAQAWLGLIAQELSEHDPENATVYAANAEAAQAELQALSEEIKAQLAPVRDAPFLVFHDAYQYFETAFGISAAGAISLSDAVAPGPARIAALREMAEARGVTCVFSEPQFDPKLVETVFGEGVSHGVIDPLGSQLAAGPGHYPQMLRDMAGAMVACVSGAS